MSNQKHIYDEIKDFIWFNNSNLQSLKFEDFLESTASK